MKITIPNIAGLIPIVSVSGGKDSTATMLALREAGVEGCRYVFSDTGWEAQETYDHIDDLAHRLGITIDRVGVPGGMVAKIEERAGFAARTQRWCTRTLKIIPLREYHEAAAIEAQADTISVVGIRNAESAARAAITEEYEFVKDWDGYVWRPILRWSVADVLAIHHRHGIPVNPLYRKGFSRVGCNPCIYASKEEIELTAEHFPERIAQIRGLELACEDMRRERNAETPDRYKHEVASFFQSKEVTGYTVTETWENPDPATWPKHSKKAKPRGPRPQGVAEDAVWIRTRTPTYKPMHIGDVVAWSRTSRGGKQLKIIREDPGGGCYRWGMCEPPTRDGAGDE